MLFLRHKGGWVILLSFMLALLLDIIPLPLWVDRFRPDWPALILIYWSMALPHRVGIGSAWVLGLLVDAAKGTLIGQHALALLLMLCCHFTAPTFLYFTHTLPSACHLS